MYGNLCMCVQGRWRRARAREWAPGRERGAPLGSEFREMAWSRAGAGRWWCLRCLTHEDHSFPAQYARICRPGRSNSSALLSLTGSLSQSSACFPSIARSPPRTSCPAVQYGTLENRRRRLHNETFVLFLYRLKSKFIFFLNI